MTSISQQQSTRTVAGASIGDFVIALDLAQATLREISERAMAELGGGITMTQLRLLDRLTRMGESRLIDLADALSIAPSTATRLCDTLAERQLIVRHRRGRDRRELQIQLTDAGTHLVKLISERTMVGWENALEHVPAETRKRVVTILGHLTKGADNLRSLVVASDISA